MRKFGQGLYKGWAWVGRDFVGRDSSRVRDRKVTAKLLDDFPIAKGGAHSSLVQRPGCWPRLSLKIRRRSALIWLDLLGSGWIRVDFGLIELRGAPEGFVGL